MLKALNLLKNRYKICNAAEISAAGHQLIIEINDHGM
jgi:hypothetical protein